MADKKLLRIELRCTIEEKERIQEAAKNANITVSQYLLNANNKNFIYRSSLLKFVEDVAYNDNKLENNINQIAKNFNSKNYVFTDNSLNNLLDNLNRVEEKRTTLIKNLQKIIKLISE